jgi:hypothetical protein
VGAGRSEPAARRRPSFNGGVSLHPVVIKRLLTGATALGALLPWVSSGPIVISGTSAMEGKLALLAGLLGLFISFSPPIDPRARTFDAVLAGAALLGCAWFWEENFGRSHLPSQSTGYGLLLCAASAAGWSVWIAWDHQRSVGRNRRPRGSRDWR